MSINDQNRSRKTYSFFRAQPVGVASTIVSGTLGVTVNGTKEAVLLSIDDNIVATVTGTQFTGPVSASAGLSGSLQQVAPSLSYLVAGSNVTITSQSNGQVIIAASGGGGGGSDSDWTVSGNSLYTTSSIVVGQSTSAPTDASMYVSGTVGLNDANARLAVFGGDIFSSGTLSLKFYGNNLATSGMIRMGMFASTGSSQTYILAGRKADNASDMGVITANYTGSSDYLLFGNTSVTPQTYVGASTGVFLRIANDDILTCTATASLFKSKDIMWDASIAAPQIVHLAKSTGSGADFVLKAQNAGFSGDGGSMYLVPGYQAGSTGKLGHVTIGTSSWKFVDVFYDTYGIKSDFYVTHTGLTDPALRVYSQASPATDDTFVLIYVEGQGLKRISTGVTGSGGSGYRVLRVPD